MGAGPGREDVSVHPENRAAPRFCLFFCGLLPTANRQLSTALCRSPSVGRLVEALAHEVYRQLSNRHSLNTAFLPTDIVKLLRAFVEMSPTSQCELMSEPCELMTVSVSDE
jgi:hypothetical protein